MSRGPDAYVVVKMKAPQRDLVLNAGVGDEEKCAELVTVLRSVAPTEVPVHFEDRITYNNARLVGYVQDQCYLYIFLA